MSDSKDHRKIIIPLPRIIIPKLKYLAELEEITYIALAAKIIEQEVERRFLEKVQLELNQKESGQEINEDISGKHKQEEEQT